MTNIVITGASSGIGLATARKLLAEGWQVIGTYHYEPAAIDDPFFSQVHLDLASNDSIAAACAEIGNLVPHLDALVNNAAVFVDYHDVRANLDAIRKTFEVNLYGTIDLTERLLQLFLGSGHIVNISSGMGAITEPINCSSSTGYRMSKVSINMYTKTLAFRLKKRGILVSSLDPGWVKTDMGRIGGTDPDREPEEAAEDIYRLLLSVTEPKMSGNFWHLGHMRNW